MVVAGARHERLEFEELHEGVVQLLRIAIAILSTATIAAEMGCALGRPASGSNKRQSPPGRL